MTSSTSLSVEAWESSVECSSAVYPGVRFRIARISFGRRVDLAGRLQALAQRIEFLEAGGGIGERLEAAALANEIDRVYAEWALIEVSGLLIDGEPATPSSLLERGPLPLASEAIAAIKRECGLSEVERKN